MGSTRMTPTMSSRKLSLEPLCTYLLSFCPRCRTWPNLKTKTKRERASA